MPEPEKDNIAYNSQVREREREREREGGGTCISEPLSFINNVLFRYQQSNLVNANYCKVFCTRVSVIRNTEATTYVIARVLQTRRMTPSLIYKISFPFVKLYK